MHEQDKSVHYPNYIGLKFNVLHLLGVHQIIESKSNKYSLHRFFEV